MHKLAAPSFLEALGELIKQVETEKIALADSKGQTVFYGQRYILSSIAELFDPLLANLMPHGSVARNIANSIAYFLPLSSSLTLRKNCKYVADNLDKLSKDIKSFSDYEPDQKKHLRESIHCLMATLDAVQSVLPLETLNWCDYCFRRAAINSDYCDVHKPSNDTDYRTGKRIHNTLSKEMLDHRARYRTARRTLGESFNLISKEEDIIPAISKGPSILVPERVAQLTEWTISDWASARVTWTHIIENECSSLSKIFLTDMPYAHNSWDCWTDAIKKNCQDETEYTTHPYWILNILSSAECWFSAENSVKDLRKSDTPARIKALWATDTTTASEIAEQLNISRQYVSRVIKKLNLLK